MSERPVEMLKEDLENGPKLVIGETELTFDFDDLDDYHRDKAEKELRETPEVVDESISELRAMLDEEEDFYLPVDDEFLKRFLRPCKWYPKSAFKLIKRFYRYRQNHPEFYANLLPSNERELLLSGCLTPVPRRSQDGVRMLVIEAGRKWHPKEVSLNQIFRGTICNLEVAVCEPKTQVSGVRVIIDMDGLSLGHVTYFTPSFASAIIEFVSRALPCRLKGVHIVNQSWVFDMVFAFFKPFLHGKLKDRIFFHNGERSKITDYIDAKALPKKYGGELEFPTNSLGDDYIRFSHNFDNYFTETNKYGYLEE
ncbi:alpha-tocopherol transfer protein-like [Trichogramma pretiosum]|uniref:alpha-tocopherol transfer protein-like n=1 Tax=Trichogramma pretiosum TaxID=7493 RepID=UPI0006C9AEC5|nr:alpha-tocopherol transfer protein-like [Trichogramma pretiosum]XP_014237733.1 alpha-tocopherol transfer protein-like [Trichogramma pretiosum]XP_014237734.1 alpha-tocopherol transfer protein-like [Trichogramma pretiosum]XP_014237735.1 alpha-tocopherol transfer protein-like [Trichogramma pretiosum]XP_014237738.1 alpha-tocopherol transfer protein-like [Trichogramma pretiosum]